MILFGGQSGSCVPGDEKAKSGSYGALDATMTYPTLCHITATECDTDKKGDLQLIEFLNTIMYLIEQ